jgi:hypothetical protein
VQDLYLQGKEEAMTLRRLLNDLESTVALQNLTTLRWDEYRLTFEFPHNNGPGASYIVISRRNGATGAWAVLWKVDVTIVDECLQGLANELAESFAFQPDARKVA